jgi:nitrite reductase/ring-hydroxylating ferredoxin subunit
MQQRQTGDEFGPTADWRNLGPCQALREKGRQLVKLEGRQIALFRTEKGLFAINNRCPHEGFPLMEGTLNDACSLACNWHGWAFDLESGEALEGRDAVRTYPVERRGADIWLDITPVSASLRATRALADLEEALAEHDYERIARSLARLEQAGRPLEDAARATLRWSLPRLEQGCTHAQAGLADWLALAADRPETAFVAHLEALGHFAWDGLFSPPLDLPDGAKPWSESCYLAEVEAMDSLSAMARVRGAFAAGLSFADLAPVMRRFVFSHYMGFGHPAIYLVKIAELIARLGPEVAEPLCLQFTKYLCVAAREDLIPEFRAFRDYLSVDGGHAPVPAPEAFSGQSVRGAMALAAGSAADEPALFDSLLGAAALNMLRFDLSLQQGVRQAIAKNVSWLDFTHAITFAEALHTHAGEDPLVWRSGLMQLACFIGRNGWALDDLTDLTDLAEPGGRWHVADPAAFLEEEKSALFNMDAGDYIYGVHRLKMLCAVEKITGFAGERTSGLVLAATHRYLKSPLRQRHPARAAYQARQTVAREG